MSAQATEADVIVVGSGAAGLATAVTAAWLGLDVVVLEKEQYFGGTSAWSGGWLWIPRNPLAVASNIIEDIEKPLAYLRAELGEGFDAVAARRFLEQGPRMVSFFQRNTSVDFIDGNAIPDFHDTSDGAGFGGRSVCAKPFDGRLLGRRLHDLKPPLELIAPFGMGIASGADIRHFLNATRKMSSFVYVARRMLRHLFEKVIHGRGMHLVNGNALIARLLKSADTLGVRLLKNMPVHELVIENGRVVGVRAGQDSAQLFRAARGVVLASGGFPHDEARKKKLFAHAPAGREHFSAAPRGNTGDGIRIAEAAGAMMAKNIAQAGAWAAVSLVPQRNGSVGHFPHLLERAKPGLIMVRRDGRRFTNEANSYHDVMQDLFAATPAGESVECWMICDHKFQRRYGLGRARPRPFPLRHWITNGYLRKGHSIAELAQQCGMDGAALADTISYYNGHAREGRDPAFGRGTSAYNKIQGEPEQKPNPCVAPIVHAPFYAVRIVPGSLGTFAGLATDLDMRVLAENNQPIAGLFAVGNDAASIMAGRYPAGGITLGPGMTGGYIAAHALAGVPLDNNHNS